MNIGKYKHYKGQYYDVIGVATHTETSESLVIYTGKNGKIWARPEMMFNGLVSDKGKEIPRFVFVGQIMAT